MHIMTLMSGTIVAQIIMFAFMPILTRLYTPSEFGTYALFFSIITVISVISSWKYDQAIMLPKSDRDAQALIFLSVLITMVMVGITAFLLGLFYKPLILYYKELKDVIWMIPIGILLTGLNQIAIAYTSRRQYYKKLASTRVVISATTVSVQSVSKYMLKMDGLIFGKLLADLIALVLLIEQHLKRQTIRLRHISRRRVYANAKRYETFPKYESLSGFINEASQMLPVFLLTYLYSAEVSGLYALTVRVLQVPVTLIGSATRQVYYQRASKMFAAGENIYDIYLKTTISLLRIFFIPLTIILIFGKSLFGFVFGEEWAVSGEYAQVLIIWFLFIFINSPTMISYSILRIQKVAVIVQLISIILKILALYIGYWYESVYLSIVFFMIASVVSSLINMAIIYMRIRKI